jgi:hypothetical protein
VQEPETTQLVKQLQGLRVPFGTLALLLHLSRLRSEYIIGRALAEKFPTEDDWVGFTSNRWTVEELSEFAGIVRDLRSGRTPILSPKDVENAAAQHTDRLLESVSIAAETLGVRPEDLVNALITA